VRYDWYGYPVQSGWTPTRPPDSPPSRIALALAWWRLRERRTEVPDIFQVVVANMCAGADQPRQAAITCDGVDRVQLDGGPLGPVLTRGKVS